MNKEFSQAAGTIVGTDKGVVLIDSNGELIKSNWYLTPENIPRRCSKISQGYGGLYFPKSKIVWREGDEDRVSFWNPINECKKIAFTIQPFTLEEVPCINLRISAEEVIELHRKYIELLGNEIDELVAFTPENWESTRFEKGKSLREQIINAVNEYTSQPTQQLSDEEIEVLQNRIEKEALKAIS